MIKVITIRPEDIEVVQDKHVASQTYKDTIAYLFDMNKNNPTFLESPIFVEYQKKSEIAVKDFDKAKNDMFNKYIIEAGVKNPIHWTLDYSTGELSIEF